MSTYSVSRRGKFLAIIITFFALGFLGVCFFLGLSYGDDRAELSGNHPLAAEQSATQGDADPSLPLNLQIRFKLRNRDALDRLLAEQQNPASPRFHKWLKTGEFFQHFGPTKTEVHAVSDWLAAEGFTITNVSAGHLEFTGSVDQAQRTFAVKIARFGSRDGYANTADPFIPARFANVVGAIVGLDNMTHAAPVSQFTNGGGFEPEAIVGGFQAFGPNDFYSFYDENTAAHDGTGDCIAIVGVSDFLDSTMSAFTTQFNLPPISYTKVLHGSNPGINGAEAESELDLQWAHAAAPGASIVFHLGGSIVDDIAGAVSENRCGAISISFGFCGPSAAFINGVIHPLFQQAAAQGQSVFVSSGDQGAAGIGYDPVTNSCVAGNSPSVNEMSADPDVTSVGGTQFKPQYSNGNDQGYVTESAWNDVSGATGGGASQIFSKPDYQTGPGVPNDGARDVPDVAMMASPNAPGALFGHDMGGTGQVVCCIGGTSLSAPLWGAFSRVVAEVVGQTRLGNFNNVIYQLANTGYAAAGFHDVSIGNNGYNNLPGFNAGPGYDQATGWGTVDFEVFANAANILLNPSATPTATATPTPTPTPTLTPTPTATPTPVGGVLSVPTAVNFPVTATGRPVAIKTLTMRNLSRTSPLQLDVGALAAPFSVAGGGHYTIAPGSRADLTIYFNPTTSGTGAANLDISSSDPSHAHVSVKVTATVKGGKLSAPPKVALAAAMSATATKTVILKNSGSGTLSGSAQAFGPSSPFSIVGGPVHFLLGPGQTQPVTIEFKPSTPGIAQGNLLIALVEPAGTASIDISGSAK